MHAIPPRFQRIRHYGLQHRGKGDAVPNPAPVFIPTLSFAKAFGDDAGTRSAYNWRTEKAQQVGPSHVINALFVYNLPFKSKLLAHWQLSGITTFRSGQLFGTIAAACNLPNVGGCYADYNAGFNSPVRINGDYGIGDVRGTSYVDRAAFANPAAFNYGNTPRTDAFGLRGPSNSNQSLSLKREFVLHEDIKFSLQADAFNVFNWVRFAACVRAPGSGPAGSGCRHRAWAYFATAHRTSGAAGQSWPAR